MTRVPRPRDSATFSAASRQTEQRMNRVSPSFHSLLWRSNARGVDATVKFATAAPDGVNRSSGSPVMLPMTVSPAIASPLRWVRGSGAGAQQLGPQHRLVESELAVELLGRGGLRGHVDDGVDPLGLLLDLVGQPTAAPDVDVVDTAAVLGDDGEELVEGRCDGPLVQLGVQDDHEFVLTHALTHLLWSWRSRSLRDRRVVCVLPRLPEHSRTPSHEPPTSVGARPQGAFASWRTGQDYRRRPLLRKSRARPAIVTRQSAHQGGEPMDTEPAEPPPAVVAQLLATEHWSLLATRGTMWSEVMSRITILLTVLTGSLVILGLVAQAGGFGATFQMLAIGLAVVGLILGTLTSVRVFLASDEDAGLILAMNRLRAAYTELAPGIDEHFLTSTRLDEEGLMQTYSLGVRRHPMVHVVGSTNFFVGTVNTLVAGALAALVAGTLGAPIAVLVLAGLVVAALYFVVFLWAGYRTFGARQRMLRSTLA